MRESRQQRRAQERAFVKGRVSIDALPTYWNGEPCDARKVRVIVGPSPVSTWWCAAMEGTEREAVEVRYGGQVFYLDNQDHGSGWLKVTLGRGGPQAYHRSLPVARVLDPAPSPREGTR